MKIAIGGTRGIPAQYGGFETAVDETARRMSGLGHEVTVYCRTRDPKDAPKEYCGVRLVRLWTVPFKSFETIFHSLCVAFHVLFVNRDVEVVHLYNAASSFGGLILRLAGVPLVMTLDGVEWRREKWNSLAKLVWKSATWLAVRVANITICDSNTVRDFFENEYGVGIRYIPYGAKRIDTAANAFRKLGLEDGNYFLFVGRLVPEKGVDVLLDAYRLSGSKVPLVIIGDNEHDAAYVASLRAMATGSVIFLGYRFGVEYESVLAHARAYVSASRLEGTSPSLLAAMGASVCCLVNAIPENRETGGDSILYFDGTAADLAAKIVELSTADAPIEKYGELGYARVCKRYDWDAVTGRYLQAYAECAQAGGRSSHRTVPTPERQSDAPAVLRSRYRSGDSREA